MSQFDLIQLIGNQACSAATKVTNIVAAQPACGSVESWNMGVLVLAAVAVVLAVRIIQERRRRFREAYFR